MYKTCTKFTAGSFSKAESQHRWYARFSLFCADRVHTLLSFDAIHIFHQIIAEYVQTVLIAHGCRFNQF